MVERKGIRLADLDAASCNAREVIEWLYSCPALLFAVARKLDYELVLGPWVQKGAGISRSTPCGVTRAAMSAEATAEQRAKVDTGLRAEGWLLIEDVKNG